MNDSIAVFPYLLYPYHFILLSLPSLSMSKTKITIAKTLPWIMEKLSVLTKLQAQRLAAQSAVCIYVAPCLTTSKVRAKYICKA